MVSTMSLRCQGCIFDGGQLSGNVDKICPLCLFAEVQVRDRKLQDYHHPTIEMRAALAQERIANALEKLVENNTKELQPFNKWRERSQIAEDNLVECQRDRQGMREQVAKLEQENKQLKESQCTGGPCAGNP
jgi:hypothetical protein